MNKLDISIQTLLRKMEQELQEAKASGSTAKLRERIHAIKTLCELALDQQPPAETTRPAVIPMQVAPPLQQPPQVLTIQTQGKKVELEEANGDSLLDF